MNDAMHDHASHPGDEQLFDFVNGSLRRGRMREVDEHLATCARCSALVAAATQGARASAQVGVSPLPADVAQRLHAALDEQWKQTPPRPVPSSRSVAWSSMRRRLSVGLAVGATASVLVVAVLQVNGDEAKVAGTATSQESAGAPAPATAGAPQAGYDSNAGSGGAAKVDRSAETAVTDQQPTAANDSATGSLGGEADIPMTSGESVSVTGTVPAPPPCMATFAGFTLAIRTPYATAATRRELSLGPITSVRLSCPGYPQAK